MTASDVDVDRYLERIGVREEPRLDLSGLTTLMRAHLTAVPFENIDVFDGTPVRTDLAWSLAKIVDRGRGGWCYELNGAFGALLENLGFAVIRLGAAVLLDGPNSMIDHLALEVHVEDSWYLVDVGFGDSFSKPLDLNRSDPQDGGTATFEFIASSDGQTLTRHDGGGTPEPQYRFRRVAHQLQDFDAASTRLQTDPELRWKKSPFATRLIDGGPKRITLLHDVLKEIGPTGTTVIPVDPDQWDLILADRFGIQR